MLCKLNITNLAIMQLLRAKTLINHLTKGRFIDAAFLIFLCGCIKDHRIPTENHQIIQVKQANLGSNYMICKKCIDYIDLANLMRQQEPLVNN